MSLTPAVAAGMAVARTMLPSTQPSKLLPIVEAVAAAVTDIAEVDAAIAALPEPAFDRPACRETAVAEVVAGDMVWDRDDRTFAFVIANPLATGNDVVIYYRYGLAATFERRDQVEVAVLTKDADAWNRQRGEEDVPSWVSPLTPLRPAVEFVDTADERGAA